MTPDRRAEPRFSFGLLADVQYADDGPQLDLDRHFRLSPDKLRAAVTEFNRHELAFVADLGDLVDHDLANAAVPLDLLARSRAPVHHVLGNHDFAAHTEPSGRSARAAVLRAYGMPAPYYAVDQDGWRFLLLDTNEVGVIEDPPGSDAYSAGRALIDRLAARDRPNAHPWNGTIGAEQRDWLAGQLDDARRSGQHVAVLAHHPLRPAHHDNLLDDEELTVWLSGFPALRVWFNGHQHAGGYGRFADVHCVTLHGMVQSSTNAFAVVAVHDDRLELTGHGRQDSRTLVLP